MPLAAGTRLGSYEVLGPIGAGGMGEVYRARDTRLGRLVAIKILPPEKLADADRQRRFEQEAVAASALNHPNIVTIYDIGSENGVGFLVMELVSGKSLDQVIPRAGMRIGEIFRIATQIADALSKAHAGGIVHRDLKPANVMINTEGLVKILDFGLAKLTQRAESEPDATRTLVAHTEIGSVLGTAAYMSPEQAEGKPVDGRSDIFAFGSLLYEMATGQRAFRGDTAVSTMSSILRDDPLTSGQVPADLQPQLARVIARCLRKEPERRFQHMADLKVELEELREDSDSGKLSPARAMPARSSRVVIWIAVAAAVAVAAVAGFRFLADRAGAKPAPPAIPFTAVPAPAAAAPGSRPAIARANPPTRKPLPSLDSLNEIEKEPVVQAAEGDAKVAPAAKTAYELGMKLIDQEKPAEALPHFDEAIRANPNYMLAYLGRAAARRLLEQYDTSINDCNAAIRIAPDKPRPYFCRGLAEGLLSQYDLAVRDDSEVIRLDPKFVLAYENRGNAYNNLQQYDRALADFSQAIQLRPDGAQPYLRRATIYERLKQYEKAIQDYGEVIRLQPGNARAYRGRASARKLSGDERGAAADRRYARQLKER